jgi:hypothetical protein
MVFESDNVQDRTQYRLARFEAIPVVSAGPREPGFLGGYMPMIDVVYVPVYELRDGKNAEKTAATKATNHVLRISEQS